jgi:hypothetical protein
LFEQEETEETEVFRAAIHALMVKTPMLAVQGDGVDARVGWQKARRLRLLRKGGCNLPAVKVVWRVPHRLKGRIGLCGEAVKGI